MPKSFAHLTLCLLPWIGACQVEPADHYALPFPEEESSVKPGINDAFLADELDVSEWRERFEREGREVFRMRKEIVTAAGIRPGMAVADIGAGTGVFTSLLAGQTGSQGTVYAVEIVAEFLDLISQRAEAMDLQQVVPVLCTEKSVKLPEDSIDIAFLCDVYHHFEYPRTTMASIHHALRSDGELVLVEFRRIEGVSSDWILGHVRAGQEVFTAEIEASGFELIEETELLEDSYYLRFRKTEP